MENTEKLGKRALILGGSGYIGSAVVKAFSQAGINCVFSYHQNKEKAESLCQEFDCDALHLDLSNPSAISACFDYLERDNILPNIYVHCAAAHIAKSFSELALDEWEYLQRVNCFSAFSALQSLQQQATRHPGTIHDIAFLSAVNNRQVIDLPLHFAAIQGYINQLTATATKSFGPLGVRINSVVPGMLEDGLSTKFPTDLLQDYLQFSALGRKGKAEEVATTLLWLVTQNTYINGQCIPVNGGI